jgi:hypothetical protein
VAIGAKHVDNASAVGNNHATILHAQISGVTRIVLPSIFKLDNLHRGKHVVNRALLSIAKSAQFNSVFCVMPST